MNKYVLYIIAAIATVALAWTIFSLNKKGFDPNAHEIRHENYWGIYNWKEEQLIDKIRNTPKEILDYLYKDNLQQGYPNIPHNYELTPKEQKAIKNVLTEIPNFIQDRIKSKLLGIFFVDDLGGSAYTEFVYSHAGKPAFGFIVVDRLLFDKPANEWASWRENTAFYSDDSSYELKMQIADERNNAPEYALQFVILHELGHIFAIGSDVHPPWNLSDLHSDHPSSYRFSRFSWTVHSNKYVSIFDHEFTTRAQISFYREKEKRLPLSRSPLIYRDLRDLSNFPSLYALTQPSEDFAESFATYIHQMILKRPYEIQIKKADQIVLRYSLCWKEIRCAEKRAELEKIIGITN